MRLTIQPARCEKYSAFHVHFKIESLWLILIPPTVPVSHRHRERASIIIIGNLLQWTVQTCPSPRDLEFAMYRRRSQGPLNAICRRGQGTHEYELHGWPETLDCTPNETGDNGFDVQESQNANRPSIIIDAGKRLLHGEGRFCSSVEPNHRAECKLGRHRIIR